MNVATSDELLSFWRAAGPDRWFASDAAFDAEIRRRFLATYEAAAVGRLSDWEEAAEGALALTIALDQFPRNMFRGAPRAFTTDPLARAIARRAIARGFDAQMPVRERNFFYLPFEHSEDLSDQEYSVALAESTGDAENIKWARLHDDVIRRFGRFPHRNEILGRVSTPEEIAFLKSGGFRA
jgi:uncharacterized protein (DUF924 family)